MMNKEKTAQEILAIKYPGDLFLDSDIYAIKSYYIQLCKKYHPDVNKDSSLSNEVTAKIIALYNEALQLKKENKWQTSYTLEFQSNKSMKYVIRFQTFNEFELGTMYISDTMVFYLFDAKFELYYRNALKQIENFKFANGIMQASMEKYLPKILDKFVTQDNRFGLIIKKTPDLLLLKDVLAHYDNKIPVHMSAWILSSLYNFACFLEFNNLTHNAITLNNYFISPLYHSGALLGGWGYSMQQKKKMLGVPNEIFNLMPPIVKQNKLAHIVTDLEAIKHIGNQLIGNPSRYDLKISNAIETYYKNWLLVGASGSAYYEYGSWMSYLKSHGERKFVETKLTANDIYK